MKSAFFATCIGFLLAVFYPTSFPKPPYLALKEEKTQESKEESEEATKNKPDEYYFNVWEWLDSFTIPATDIDYSPSYTDTSETHSSPVQPSPVEPSPWDDPSLRNWVDLSDK